MIRYRCGKCQQKIRCKEAFAGRLARCPSCSHQERVPAASTRAEAGKPDDERDSLFDVPLRPAPPPPADEEEERDSLVEGPPTAPPSGGRLVRYRCPRCRLRLRAPASAAGRRARCPKCRKSAVVPGAPSTVGATSRPLVTAPPPGPFAPPGYEVHEQLGKGTFGVVYKARQVDLDRVVALKVMKPDLDPGLLPRFRSEAQAVARMQHPNIVQIFDVDEFQGRFFCALEYVEGGSLQQMLEGRPLPPRRAAEMAEGLARAMHYAHGRGVVHRDLKPANILLSRKRGPDAAEDEEDTLKITDFGLAKRLDDEDASQTVAGAIVGTPAYMAPEQAEGKEVDAAADVWALGAILYEMLTGKPPFVGSISETLNQVRFEEPVPPRQRQRGVPRDLETVCLKCLEKEPRKRYRSALELAEDLSRFLSGDPITARPVGRAERLARLCRRNPLVTALSAAAVASLLVGFVVSTALYFQAAVERAAAVEARGRAVEAQRKAEAEAARANAESDKARRFAAEAEDQRKQTQRQAERARQASKMLTGMFDAADPAGLNGTTFGVYNKAGQKMEAGQLLGRAVAMADADDRLDPAVKAIVYHDVGSVYRSVGLHDKAEALLKRALDLRYQSAASPDEVADSLHALAWLRHQRGDYLEAEKGYKDSMAKRGKGDEAARLNSLLNLGWVYVEMQETAKGERLFAEVLGGREKHFGPDHRETALVRVSMAAAYLKMGRLLDAKPHMDRALTDLGRQGVRQELIASVIKMQSAIFEGQVNGQYELALAMMDESVKLMKAGMGEKHGYVMVPLVQLAVLEENVGRLDASFGHYREAFQLGREVVGLAHPQMLSVAEHLSAHLRHRGQHKEASDLLAEMLKANEEQFGKGHVNVADVMLVSARHERDSGRWRESLELCERAEAVHAASGKAPRKHAACLDEKGRTLYRLGRYAHSEAAHRDALKARRKLDRAPDAEAVAMAANLLYALDAQGKHAAEFAEELAAMDGHVSRLHANQRPAARATWAVLKARLLCRRDGDHRAAAKVLGESAADARTPADHEEAARAYLLCLEALAKGRLDDGERAKVRGEYERAAAARARLWARGDVRAAAQLAGPEWGPIRAELSKPAVGPKK